MTKDYEQYKERHLAFWLLQDVKNPLLGFTVGAGLDSWSYWQYNKAVKLFFNKGEVKPEEINPTNFVEDQLHYLELSEQIDDDIIRSAMPLASIPWMEAILGCPIYSTAESVKCREIINGLELIEPIAFDLNIWAKKYFEFIDIYKNAFAERYPVAQSILRGPSDLACAIMGIENASIALLTEPDAMIRLLNYVTDQTEKFLKLQLEILPKFHDGYVIGQYEIWAPEPAIRIQEDFSTLYSPDLYDEFLKPLDKRLASISSYTLIHLHASSLHLINHFLEVAEIRAFQITKDPNVASIEIMIPALRKVQEAGRPLIVKGQFNKQDVDLLRNQLSTNGLCVQPVVKNLDEANELVIKFKNW